MKMVSKVTAMLVALALFSGIASAADTAGAKAFDVLPLASLAVGKCTSAAGRMLCATKDGISVITAQSGGEGTMQTVAFPAHGKCNREGRVLICAPDSGGDSASLFIIPNLE